MVFTWLVIGGDVPEFLLLGSEEFECVFLYLTILLMTDFKLLPLLLILPPLGLQFLQ